MEIHYGGSTKKNLKALDNILADTGTFQFSEANRAIADAIRPILTSEGGLSSINTWDGEFLTVAGRSEAHGRVSDILEAAENLGKGVGLDLTSQVTQAQNLVDFLAKPSPLETAGHRFEVDKIVDLIQILEGQEMFTGMVLAGLSDSILVYYGIPISGRQTVPLYNDPGVISPQLDAETETEVTDHGLHPVTMTIAIHNRIGAPSYVKVPHQHALDANRLYPQDKSVQETQGHDFAQLSRQLAYLMKLRDFGRSKFDSKPVPHDYFSRWGQKVDDFNAYFRKAMNQPGQDFFVDSAPRDVIPAWKDSPRNPERTADQPLAGNFYLRAKRKSGNQVDYIDMGVEIAGQSLTRASGQPSIGESYFVSGSWTSLDQSIYIDEGQAKVMDHAPVPLAAGTRVLIMETDYASKRGDGDPRNGLLQVEVGSGPFLAIKVGSTPMTCSTPEHAHVTEHVR